LNISIIIPTLNEQANLGLLLKELRAFHGLEIIVADGGSTDHTLAIARGYGTATVSSEPGRGVQQNMGAELATREILLFLHCDTRLPENFFKHVQLLLNQPDTAAGAFRLKIDATGAGYRLVEWGANLRSIIFKMVYGDQALFVYRKIFHQVGGFPNQLILEDVELVRRLKKIGRIQLAPVAVTTSARRWQRYGLLRTTLLNQIILASHFCKVAPERLGRLYYKNN